jgi:hypothetical protein
MDHDPTRPSTDWDGLATSVLVRADPQMSPENASPHRINRARLLPRIAMTNWSTLMALHCVPGSARDGCSEAVPFPCHSKVLVLP